MIRFVLLFFVGIVVSFFLFPVSFTFIPSNVNTKIILAVIGILFFIYEVLNKKSLFVSKGFFGTSIIALLFSIICLIATVVNSTEDYSYATYFLSFAVWSGAGYATCNIIRLLHGYLNIRLLTNYLMLVSVIQCILAIVMDNYPSIKFFVNTVFEQGSFFYEEVSRLYAIGAALDPAGVRFGIVLIMIASVVCFDENVKNDIKSIIAYLSCFAVIVVIGNIMSRTTIVGVIMSVFIFCFGSGLHKLVIRRENRLLFTIIILSILVLVIVSVYLYNNNLYFKSQLRFAFEGFFNLVEQGEWKTASTDKLNREMWVWPNDDRTWIIGSGLFDNFIYSTDIGYCRFILYCGITGFSVFSLFFIYNARVFWLRYHQYRYTFLIFLALTFIYWIKVSTDIFQIYALLYFIDRANESGASVMKNKEILLENETNLQHCSHI